MSRTPDVDAAESVDSSQGAALRVRLSFNANIRETDSLEVAPVGPEKRNPEVWSWTELNFSGPCSQIFSAQGSARLHLLRARTHLNVADGAHTVRRRDH